MLPLSRCLFIIPHFVQLVKGFAAIFHHTKQGSIINVVLKIKQGKEANFYVNSEFSRAETDVSSVVAEKAKIPFAHRDPTQVECTKLVWERSSRAVAVPTVHLQLVLPSECYDDRPRRRTAPVGSRWRRRQAQKCTLFFIKKLSKELLSHF